MRSLLLGIVALFIFFNTTVQNAYAQLSAGVEIKPSTIERGADPGEVFSEIITVTNRSDTQQTYYLVKKDISGVEDGGIPIFADPGSEVTGYELSEWLSYTIEPIVLPPDSSIQVPITITVPENATPGSHFGGIFISLEPPRLREVGAAVGYEVGAIVSIRISGDVVESARIREFSTEKLVYSNPDVEFLIRVENPGNVLIRPRGILEIKNMFGARVGDPVIVNDGLAGVFPETTRPFEVTWKDTDLAFGRYQAIVGLVYGESGRQSTVSATVSFWVLPVKIIVPVLAVLSLLILVLYLGVKIYVRRTLDGLATTQGRRVVVRRKKDVAISRLMVVAVTLLVVTTLFLIGLLVLFA